MIMMCLKKDLLHMAVERKDTINHGACQPARRKYFVGTTAARLISAGIVL
jgi:hypothetical protein